MVIVLIALWVLLFAPLIILPLLPKVEGRHLAAPRAVTERAAQQVVSISAQHQDRAA